MKNLSSAIILVIISFSFLRCTSNKNSQEEKNHSGNSTSTTWQNFEYGSIKLSYPVSWQIFMDSLHNKINLYKKSSKDTSLFAYDISMTPSSKYYLEKQTSFDQYVKMQIDQMKELYAITIQTQEEKPLNSKKSYHYTGQYLSDAGAHELVHLYFIEGSYEDLIIFSTGESSIVSEAEKIIETIKLR